MNFSELKPLDRKLLYELSLNARASFAQLARKLQTSKQRVQYRLNFLEHNNIITGYYAVINSYALGLVHYRIVLKFHGIEKNDIEKFFEYVNVHPKIAWTAELQGSYDAAFIVWARSIEEFELVYDAVLEKFGHIIGEHQFSIATNIKYLQYKIFTQQNQSKNFSFGAPLQQLDLDIIDRKLLSALSQNGRESLVNLATLTNLSVKGVRDRMKKLENKKVILGYQYKLNHTELGLTHRKLMLKLAERSAATIKELQAFFFSHSNVIYLVKVIGEYDYEIEILTRTNEFHDILAQLRYKFAKKLRSYDTFIHYREPKSGILEY